MGRAVLLNGLMNLVFAVVFVVLNNLALQNNLEETFISLALFYGVVVVVGNAIFVSMFCRK